MSKQGKAKQHGVSKGKLPAGLSRMLDASRLRILPRESFNASTRRTSSFLNSLKTPKLSGLMKKTTNLIDKLNQSHSGEYRLPTEENKENHERYTPFEDISIGEIEAANIDDISLRELQSTSQSTSQINFIRWDEPENDENQNKTLSDSKLEDDIEAGGDVLETGDGYDVETGEDDLVEVAVDVVPPSGDDVETGEDELFEVVVDVVPPTPDSPSLRAGQDGEDHDESLPLPAGDQLLAGPAQAHGQSGDAEARDDGGQAGGSGLNKFGRGTGQIMQQRKHIEENKKNQNQKNEMNSKERRERNKKFKKRLETILWKVSNFQEDIGESPDFLIMVKDDFHKKDVSHPSDHAEQYICYSEGPIKDKFLHEGIIFNKEQHSMCQNNKSIQKDRQFDDMEVRQLIVVDEDGAAVADEVAEEVGADVVEADDVEEHQEQSEDTEEDLAVEQETDGTSHSQLSTTASLQKKTTPNIYNMKRIARKVHTPGGQSSSSSDNGTHIYSKTYKGKSLSATEGKKKKQALQKKRYDKSKKLSRSDITSRIPSQKKKKSNLIV